MNDQTAAGSTAFRHLSLAEKLEYLQVLSDVVSDIRAELARAEAERAALTSSVLESDLHRVSAVRGTPH
ncbi:hypothetical protein [Blastococcus mobilis]|uniref:Uncharacterized protein n=1 Tax=Blastococcus mobilis TaxID=1938746 RepID=A0A238UT11_9ACTN|nr:hypothetical protein [Blastococcus mobilis]SNR24489.1 hypothetical protein SAMN06272737_101260 [Blastococcus mobilis]